MPSWTMLGICWAMLRPRAGYGEPCWSQIGCEVCWTTVMKLVLVPADNSFFEKSEQPLPVSRPKHTCLALASEFATTSYLFPKLWRQCISETCLPLKKYPDKRPQTVLEGTWRRETEIPGLDSASALCQELCKDRVQDLLDRFCVEAAVHDPFVYKVSVRDFKKKIKVGSLRKLSIRDLWARSLFSSPGLCTSSLKSISRQDLC